MINPFILTFHCDYNSWWVAVILLILIQAPSTTHTSSASAKCSSSRSCSSSSVAWRPVLLFSPLNLSNSSISNRAKTGLHSWFVLWCLITWAIFACNARPAPDGDFSSSGRVISCKVSPEVCLSTLGQTSDPSLAWKKVTIYWYEHR